MTSGKTHSRIGRRPGPTRGQLLAAATAFLYASQNLAMRAAAPSADALVVTLFAGFPTLLTSLALILGSPRRRRQAAGMWKSPGGRKLLGWLALGGVAMYLVGNPLFVKALALGGAVVATPASNTVVIWSALLAWWLLGERLTARAWTGVAVFVAGVVVLSVGQSAGAAAGPDWLLAIPLAAASGLLWSSGSIVTRHAAAQGTDTFIILAGYAVTGLGLILVVTLAGGQLAGFAHHVAAASGGLGTLTLMVLAGLFNLGGQISLTLAFTYESVARASVIVSSSVAIVAVMAWAVLGETLTPLMFTGVLASFGGAALVQGREAGGEEVKDEDTP